MDPSGLHKLIVVGVALPLFVYGGLRHWVNPVIVAILAIAAVSMLLGRGMPVCSVGARHQTSLP